MTTEQVAKLKRIRAELAEEIGKEWEEPASPDRMALFAARDMLNEALAAGGDEGTLRTIGRHCTANELYKLATEGMSGLTK